MTVKTKSAKSKVAKPEAAKPKAPSLSDVPVMRKEMEHIELAWAELDEDWVLVRDYDTTFSVATIYSYGTYERVHGPFNIQEVRQALALVARRSTEKEDPSDYMGGDAWWEKVCKDGVAFWEGGNPALAASPELPNRAFFRSGEDEVKVFARCGETYAMSLSKLRLILRKADSLKVSDVN